MARDMLIRHFCQLGTPTILINNAAIVHSKAFLDLAEEEIEMYVLSHSLSPSFLSRKIPRFTKPPILDALVAILRVCINDLLLMSHRTYRVNVLSHYHTIQTFLPDMLKRPNGGTIVTVSSVLGKLGCAGLCKS